VAVDGNSRHVEESWYMDVVEMREPKDNQYPDHGLDYTYNIEYVEKCKVFCTVSCLTVDCNVLPSTTTWDWLPMNRFDHNMIIAISGDEHGYQSIWIIDNHERLYEYPLTTCSSQKLTNDPSKQHLSSVTDLCFLDHHMIVSVSTDESMILWDIQHGSDEKRCFIKRIERPLSIYHDKQYQQLKSRNRKLVEELARLENHS